MQGKPAELSVVTIQTNGHTEGSALPRYERPPEPAPETLELNLFDAIPFAESDTVIAESSLSQGSQALLRGLLRLGFTKVFPGGGVGIEYGSLLKTAARPEYTAEHVAEAAAHLTAQRVDLLLVPGMSGYPIGAMYSVVSGIPAILLKKSRLAADGSIRYPPGSFVIPSYTGDGDVVMSADLQAAQDIVDAILTPQLTAQQHTERPVLRIRVAGADDIIDKATMSQAVGESAIVIGQTAANCFVERHRQSTADQRPIDIDVQVVAWVTPLIKGYNRPQDHLLRLFGIRPFAGLNLTSLHLQPRAIGVEGIGIVAFAKHS